MLPLTKNITPAPQASSGNCERQLPGISHLVTRQTRALPRVATTSLFHCIKHWGPHFLFGRCANWPHPSLSTTLTPAPFPCLWGCSAFCSLPHLLPCFLLLCFLLHIVLCSLLICRWVPCPLRGLLHAQAAHASGGWQYAAGWPLPIIN